jgi:hypothetical protein
MGQVRECVFKIYDLGFEIGGVGRIVFVWGVGRIVRRGVG